MCIMQGSVGPHCKEGSQNIDPHAVLCTALRAALRAVLLPYFTEAVLVKVVMVAGKYQQR